MELVEPKKTVIVCPTLACNCRCWYCYQAHTPVHMKEATIVATENFLAKNIFQLNYGEWFWLEFFGGEPMLCMDTILRIANSVRNNCINNSIFFLGSITTNGTLLNKNTLQQLENVCVSHLQITIDGTPDFHDRQRYLCNGKGTWEQIWKGLLSILESSFRCNVIIRVHYRIEYLQEAVQLIKKYINPTFSGDSRFSIVFQEIKALNLLNSDNQFKIYSTRERQRALAILNDAVLYSNMVSNLNVSEYMCYATKPSSIVIMPDGSLAKCTVSFKEIGKLDI